VLVDSNQALVVERSSGEGASSQDAAMAVALGRP